MKHQIQRILFEPGKKQFYFICVLFILAFLLTKLTYFFFYPVWCTTIDIYSYTDPLISITKGHLPVFDMRTPVYPMLLVVTYYLGMSLNGVLLFQMIFSLLTCLASVYLIYKYKRGFFMLFSVFLLLFYCSGEFTAMNTNLSPTSLFTDFILGFAVFLLAGFESGKLKYFTAASITFALIILLRPQGLFLLGILIPACVIYYINFKNFKVLIPLLLPVSLSFLLLLTYNNYTFGKFRYSKFDTLSKLCYIINIIDVNPAYPASLNETIVEVKKDLGYDAKSIIAAPGFNFYALDSIYNNGRYAYGYAFMDFIKNDPESIEKLISTSQKNYPQDKWKQFIICFLRFYKLEAKTNYFYYNELTNRKKYIDGTEYPMIIYKDNYPIIWRDWYKPMSEHKIGNFPILEPNCNYSVLLKKEPFLLRQINRYEFVYNLIFSRSFWQIIYFITIIISGLLILFKLFRFSKIDSILLWTFVPLLNSILVSLIIPPIYYYVFPTKLFFMLAPFILAYYFFESRNKKSVAA